MNNRKKILTDRKLPDSAEIAGYNNFDKVLGNYTLIKKLLLHKTMIWSVVAVVTVFATALILYNTQTKTAGKQVAKVIPDTRNVNTETPFIAPPLNDISVAYTERSIDAKKGAWIRYPSGTSIHVPANAFVFEDGSPVIGEVNIKFREFNGPKDIFLSGIPMGYDSAGKNYTLESAGMIELSGFSDNKPVVLKQGKGIHVKMKSDYTDNNYNLYRLDEEKREWIYAGRDSVQKISGHKMAAKPSAQIQKFEYPTDDKFDDVDVADNSKYRFQLQVDKKQFPELALYDNVMFEVTDNNFNSKFYKIKWDNMILKAGPSMGSYIANLKKADTTIAVNVKPVLSENDYKSALEKFTREHKEYEENVATKEEKRNDQLVSIAKTSGITNRVFMISQMGVWNCDRPLSPLPDELSIDLGNLLLDHNNNVIVCNNIYVVEKNKNTVFTYNKGRGVKINTKSQNLVWAVSDKGQIVFIRLGDYNRLYRGQQNKITVDVVGNKELALAQIDEFAKGSHNKINP
ncbi:MAG: hypothetical protein HYU69_01205 [Bacteroidetes bacterium]|nr:hypothetical protein [Bacteroidota bacterium]